MPLSSKGDDHVALSSPHERSDMRDSALADLDIASLIRATFADVTLSVHDFQFNALTLPADRSGIPV